MLDDPVQVGILVLQQLMEPMNQFDVGVPPKFAENGGRFGGAEQLGIEFAKQVLSVDFSHGAGSCSDFLLRSGGTLRAGANHRSIGKECDEVGGVPRCALHNAARALSEIEA